MGDAEGESGIVQATVFLDENHSENPWLHEALERAGVHYVRHSAYFEKGVEDTVWIPVVARQEWIVLTADARIRTNLLERQAIVQNRVRLFYFVRNNIAGEEMGRALTKALPRMLVLCRQQEPPFAASISRTGDVLLRNTFEAG